MNTPKNQNAGDDCPATTCSLSDDFDWVELKLAINNAIWMHAPEDTTLAQAEEAALLAVGHLNKCFEANDLAHPPRENR